MSSLNLFLVYRLSWVAFFLSSSVPKVAGRVCTSIRQPLHPLWSSQFITLYIICLTFLNRALWYTYVIRTNKMHTFIFEVRHPRCVGSITKNFCVLHIQSNTHTHTHTHTHTYIYIYIYIVVFDCMCNTQKILRCWTNTTGMTHLKKKKKGRVELYFYFPYGPYGLYRASVPAQGCTLPFNLYLYHILCFTSGGRGTSFACVTFEE